MLHNHIHSSATESERRIPIQLQDPSSFECADGIHQKPWRQQIDADSLTFLFDVATNDKCGKEWKTTVVVRIVVLAQCCIEVLHSLPPNELAQAFGNSGSVEFLLGQLLTSALDTALDEPQLHRIHVHMFIRTALGLHQIRRR